MELTTELLKYVVTSDFRQGVYVEVAGMLIELTLVALLVPLVVWLLTYRQRTIAKTLATFFSMQFLRDWTLLLVRSGGVDNPQEALKYELAQGRLNELFSHFFYGNTADLLALLKNRMTRGMHVLGHRSLATAEISSLGVSFSNLLLEVDRLIFLFASLKQSKTVDKLFQARPIVMGWRDHFQQLAAEKEGAASTNIDVFRSLSTSTAAYIDEWFTATRSPIDRRFQFSQHLAVGRLIFSLPLLLIYRATMPLMARLRHRPYVDPWRSNVMSVILQRVSSANPQALATLSARLQIPEPELQTYVRGYKYADDKIAQRIYTEVRSFFSPPRWNDLLFDALLSDLERRKLDVATTDAAKAQAVVTWSQASIPVEGEELGTERLMRLMFFRS